MSCDRHPNAAHDEAFGCWGCWMHSPEAIRDRSGKVCITRMAPIGGKGTAFTSAHGGSVAPDPPLTYENFKLLQQIRAELRRNVPSRIIESSDEEISNIKREWVDCGRGKSLMCTPLAAKVMRNEVKR